VHYSKEIHLLPVDKKNHLITHKEVPPIILAKTIILIKRTCRLIKTKY